MGRLHTLEKNIELLRELKKTHTDLFPKDKKAAVAG